LGKPSSKGLPQGKFLFVNVALLGQAFHVSLEFDREVTWTLPNGTKYDFVAQTWQVEALGTSGSDGSYVLSVLDQKLDEFLNAYIKANQEDITH
jgi:hypothetical protein